MQCSHEGWADALGPATLARTTARERMLGYLRYPW